MRYLKQDIGGPIIGATPNWVNPVNESVTYMTGIITSRDHSEQREALRASPRHAYTYTYDHLDDAATRLEGQIEAWPTDGLFVLPVPHRYVSLSGPHNAGFLVLTLDQAAPWWIVDGMFLVIEDENAREVVEVASSSGSTVNIASALTRNFASGSRVWCAVRVRYPEEMETTSLVNRHFGGVVRFEADPAQPVGLPPAPDYGVHEGYPVFDFLAPNWISPPKRSITADRFSFDPGTGVRADWQRNDFSLWQVEFEFSPMSPEQAEALFGFFHDRKGRRGGFWLPSQRQDFEVASNASSGTNSLTVLGEAFANAFIGSKTRRSIIVRWPDGCYQVNSVTEVTTSGGNSVLTLEENWGRDIAAGEFGSWCYFARFASDTLELAWVTSEVAVTSVPFAIQQTEQLADSGASSVRPVEIPNYNYPSVFDDPANTITFVIGDNHLSIPAAEAGKWVVNVTLYGDVWESLGTPGPAIGSGAIGVRFLDASDQVISGTTESEGFTNGIVDLEFEVEVPPGAAKIEVSTALVPTTLLWAYVREYKAFAWVSAPNWGVLSREGVIQCP